jgi:transglutaminase-like putative cysteine protease
VSRARVPESLIAGLATAVVAWPLTTLFAPATWVRPTLGMIAVVVACGMLARLATTSWALVALAQVAGATVASGWIYGRGHLWHGLPTPDMVLAFNNLLVQARETVQNYAAPAPTNRGVILGVGLAIAAAGIIVDHLAVMRRSPAMAGLPLLTTFLISASNSGSSLHPMYFVAAGAVWLLMLGRQGIASLRRWSTTVPMSTAGRRSSDDRDGAYGYAAVGRSLAVAGLAAAVVLPLVIPHLPTRYLIDGLGRSANATGFSDGQIGLRSTLDLQKNLENPSTAPVLTYTTNAPSLAPLRVGVLDTYRNGKWAPDPPQVDFSRRPAIPQADGLDPTVPRETYRVSVDDSRIEAPQIAAPTPLVSGDLDGGRWGLDRVTQVASVERSARSYSFSYLDLEPSQGSLDQSREARGGVVGTGDLAVDPDSESTVRAVLADIVPKDANRIEAARAIQKYLRTSGGFRYSLQLAGPIENEHHQLVMPDPITHFLLTKQGYCVQFASAMVMMARASGIPARMAIGFLPGRLDKGAYTVRASDAHAWPELYFDGIGWLRFEPTPSGEQNTVAPDYSLAPTSVNGSGSATTGAGAPTTRADTRPDGRNDPGATDTTQQGGSTGVTGWIGETTRSAGMWVLLGLLIGILGSLAVPLAARSRLRRRLREAPDEAGRVEVEWQSLVERIGDLGIIAPRGSTPRQAGRFYSREAYLEGEESQALHRIVNGIERSRYAPPGTVLTDIRADTASVVHAVSAVRRRKDRVRAAWWPTEGLIEWRERRDGVVRLVRLPFDRLADWWRERH